FCQAEDGIRDRNVTGVQTCALPILYDGDDSGAPTTVTSKINIQTRPLRDPITGEIGGTSGNIIHELDGKFKEPRDYYYPIPIEALELNDKLEQNPGW